MTASEQHSVGSPFGAESTATEVLGGVDLGGKLVVMTGGYSGIGLEATRALVAAGAHVVVPARRPQVAREAVAGIGDGGAVEVAELDLGDQASIAAFAEGFLASGRDIHLTVTCAAVMAAPYSTVGPGWESQFGINHLGHYALVNRLWPAIARGQGRVVALSSTGHRRGGIRWDDVDFREGYDKWRAYGQAKSANALFAVQLDALARSSGVRAFSVHPGGILTPLQRHLEQQEMIDLGWIDAEGNVLAKFKTPEQGAATQVWAATSPLLDGRGGLYCEDCDVAEVVPPGTPGVSSGVRPWAIDPDDAARLWALSAERTGVDAFAG